jgi:Fe-S-cluster containining protein
MTIPQSGEIPKIGWTSTGPAHSFRVRRETVQISRPHFENQMPVESCTCKDCISACKRIPGIFHPIEALRAIRAGHVDDLMMVGVEEGRKGWKWAREEWWVLMPVSAPPAAVREFRTINPHERREVFEAAGRCVFLNVDGRCAIHDSGFKPTECRAALLCRDGKSKAPDRKHESTKQAWRSPVGAAVIGIWRRERLDQNRSNR